MMRTYDYSTTIFAPGKRITHSTLSAVFKASGQFVVHDNGGGNFVIECELIDDATALQFGHFIERIPFD